MPTQTDPFFVVGAQRSGTTLFRLMLNRHPRLCVPYESVFVTELDAAREPDRILDAAEQRRLLDTIARHPFVIRGGMLDDPDAIPLDGRRTYPELVDTVFRRNAHRNGKARWGDKTPSYIARIPQLRRLFPRSKFIHVVRDGRGVAVSMRRVRWWGEQNLLTCAARWSARVSGARAAGRTTPDDYMEIQYERLVLDPQSVLEEVCSFLGEAFDSAMLDYNDAATNGLPEAALRWHRKSVSPPDPSHADAWKTCLSSDEVALFEAVAGPTLAAFGYPLERPPWTIFTSLRWCWSRCLQAVSTRAPDGGLASSAT